MLFLLFLIACQTTKNLDITKVYRKNLVFEINDVKARGLYVSAKRPQYNLRIFLPEKPDLVMISSCHRHEIFEQPGKELSYTYRPVKGLEENCILEITALAEDQHNLWGLIEFVHDESLSAIVGCNGNSDITQGVSLCQSRAGLIQTISFTTEVYSFHTDDCPEMKPKHGKQFVYAIGLDKCTYSFSNGKQRHTLTTFGYNGVYLNDVD
jgi:hypothetical protein